MIFPIVFKELSVKKKDVSIAGKCPDQPYLNFLDPLLPSIHKLDTEVLEWSHNFNISLLFLTYLRYFFSVK